MSAARSVASQFFNQSTATLSSPSYELSGGIWDTTPPATITQGTVANPGYATWESESSGVMTGTQGNATYTLQDNQTTLTTTWDNPYSGSNGYSITLSGPLQNNYSVGYTGGDGDNATVQFYLKNA